MADDQMGYVQMAQDALRTVVRSALERAATPEGLPGGHHFYITFKTRASGVVVPENLLTQYPEEMTIVLKTKFWDLVVEDGGFSVNLTFSGVPARLNIPFKAISKFFDPVVPFGLQFEVEVPPPPAPEVPVDGDGPSEGGGEVLSLDAFRKR
jgi:hypothetical protein